MISCLQQTRHILKLKKIESKIEFVTKLSPNFSHRKNFNIEFILIHYTGMKNLRTCIDKFLQKESEVSCHWLISRKGVIFKIVDEKYKAWHAGNSCWKNTKMLNNNSIGIELENPGHGKNYKQFSEPQYKALEILIKEAMKKYNIDKQNILGHSDVSPDRKLDPGEYFNWERLSKKGLAYFPAIKKNYCTNNIFFQIGDKSEIILDIKKKLKKIGYNCSNNKNFDHTLKFCIEAFQRRFLPDAINGLIDTKILSRIEDIYKNS